MYNIFAIYFISGIIDVLLKLKVIQKVIDISVLVIKI